MLQLIYISTALKMSGSELDRILVASRRNNSRDNITGMLLFNGKRFLQALEGPETHVIAAFGRIKLDPCHRATVVLSTKTVEAKQFGGWAMACESTTGQPGDRTLVEVVDSLVAVVPDPNIRALFSSYVRMGLAA